VANITLRSVKGSALTFQEADNNFDNLNTAKLELADLSVTQNTASGAGTLSYNNENGVFSYTPPDLSTFNTLTTTGSTNLHSTSTTPLLLTNPAGTDNGFRISANQALNFNIVGALEIKTFNDFRMLNTFLLGNDDGTHSIIHRLHASAATIGARNTANNADVNLTLRGENLFVDSNDGITLSGGGIIELKSNNKIALEVDENEAIFYVPLIVDEAIETKGIKNTATGAASRGRFLRNSKVGALEVTRTGQGNISDGDTTSSLAFSIQGDDNDAFLGYAWMEYDDNNGNVFNITGFDDGITTFNEISLLQARPDRAAFLDNSLFFQRFTNDVTIKPGTGLAYTFESADNKQQITISNNDIRFITDDKPIIFNNKDQENILRINNDGIELIDGNLDVGANKIITTDESGTIGIDGIVQVNAVVEYEEDVFISLINGDPTGAAFLIGYDLLNETSTGPAIALTGDNQIQFNAGGEDDVMEITSAGVKLIDGNLDVGANKIITTDESGTIGIDGIVQVKAVVEFEENVFISVINGDPTGAAFLIGYDLLNETSTGPVVTFTGDNQIQFNAGGEDDVMELTANRINAFTPLRMARFTTTERNNLTPQNGDVIYNTSDHKFQGYADGAWVNLN
jgi:hypothetical protein